MQHINFLAKVFVKRHRKFLKLTRNKISWVAYGRTIKSWTPLEDILPKTNLERNIPNFGWFKESVLKILREDDYRRKYQNRKNREKRKLKK